MPPSLSHVLALLLLPFNFSLSAIVTQQFEELKDIGWSGPNNIDLTGDGNNVSLYVRLCPWTLLDEGGDWVINMTRHCYCTHSKFIDPDHETCSLPGPTLLIHSHTSVNLTLVNELVGTRCAWSDSPSDCSTAAPSPSNVKHWNKYQNADITNLYVHGASNKIIPSQVRPIARQRQPATPESWLHTYEFDFHYPGTLLWYHSQPRGSTKWQVHFVHALRFQNDVQSYTICLIWKLCE